MTFDIAHLFAPLDGLNFIDASAAIITLDDGRYLMQSRDDKPGVFYPGHWGLFGGGLEPGEDPEEGLRRELREELALEVTEARYFTRFDFDFAAFGAGRRARYFFEVGIDLDTLNGLRLGEGREMRAFAPSELLLRHPVAPYDSFALWLHDAARRKAATVREG